MNKPDIKYLDSYVGNRDNNFNLIRFVAAAMVIFTHSFALALGDGVSEPFRQFWGLPLGHIAVDIFFITSGFLITASLVNSRNFASFIWSRVLRIYPALVVAILITIFVIGAGFTTWSLESYITSSQIYYYLISNSTLVAGLTVHLPGVFEELPYPKEINGSLWTLPWELRMYGLLALFGLLVFLRKRSGMLVFKFLVVTAMCISILVSNYNYSFHVIESNSISIAFRLVSMFFMGATYYLFKDKIIISKWLFFGFILLLMLLSQNKELFYLLYSLSLAYIILYLAYVPSGKVRGFNQLGDYSYGLYIYAFPVQQSLVALIGGVTVYELIPISFMSTLILAVLSWHLIEKRALQLKKHVIKKY